MNTAATLKSVKPGDYVRLKDSATAPVWIKGQYQADTRTYCLTRADDMNHDTYKAGTATVFVGFTY